MDIAFSIFVIKYFMKKSLKTYLKTAAKDYLSRSVNPPVVRASTILFKTMQELRKFQKDIINKNKELFYHLEVGFNSKTKLVSILNTVPSKKMFDDNYPYRSSMSKTMMNSSLNINEMKKILR